MILFRWWSSRPFPTQRQCFRCVAVVVCAEKTRGKKSEEEIKAEKERLAAIRAERLRKAKEQAVRAREDG